MPSFFLVFADGLRVPVRDDLVLGRVSQCDVVLDDAKASRRHARLLVTGSVVELEDLGSHNGTLLNGKRITRRTLRDGDEIRIGATSLHFREEVEAAAAPLRPAPLPAAGVPEPAPVPARDPPGADSPEPPRADALDLARAELIEQARAELPGAGLEGDPLAGLRRPAPPAAGGDIDVLEFADDEVIAVRRREVPTALPAAGAALRRPGAVTPAREHGVLQFVSMRQRGGPLGDDLQQMSARKRLALVLTALALAAALGYVAMVLARRVT